MPIDVLVTRDSEIPIVQVRLGQARSKATFVLFINRAKAWRRTRHFSTRRNILTRSSFRIPILLNLSQLSH
jgi:hypothetical protein